MVDPTRVRTKLVALHRYRDTLGTLQEAGDDPVTRYSRRYLVQAGIQVCLDVANHLIADAGWEPVGEFRDAFTRLEEHGVINAEVAERLRAMVGMRNRLVHLYDEVDDMLVARAAREELGDWDAFARAVAAYLDTASDSRDS